MVGSPDRAGRVVEQTDHQGNGPAVFGCRVASEVFTSQVVS